MNLSVGGHALGIPIKTVILLALSATFLLAGLVAYTQPLYENQTLGYVMPGAILGAIGLGLLWKKLHEGA